MDTTDESTTNNAPLSRWHALRERWAMVRAKVAGWWVGVRATDSVGFLLFRANFVTVALLIFAGVLIGLALSFALSQPEPGAADPAGSPGLQDIAHQVATNTAAIAALQARIDQSPITEPVTSTTPWAAPASSAASSRKAAGPARPATQATSPTTAQPSGWGTTDLDRAIADFTPPTNFGATP